MTDQLMLGILLIIVGVAMGLIAVALVLNRREDRATDGQSENDSDEGTTEPEDGQGAISEGEEQESAESEEEVDLEADDGEAHDGSDPGLDALEEEESLPEEETREVAEPMEKAPRERQLVAQLYREEVTGRLIILSGDHEYTDVRQIEDETERRRLAYAASDLAGWFHGELEPRSVSAPAANSPQGSPDHMLEEINGILQRSLSPDRGVRLFPSLDGGVKVLIGVKSYEIEEVPDDEIKDLIRDAVAEWEAGR